MNRRVLTYILAVGLPWLGLAWPFAISHDVSWFYYTARGVLHGGTLYRDYIEPNAPLASLSLMPAVLLHSVLGISDTVAVHTYFLTVASASLALTLSILERMGLSSGRRIWWIVSIAVMAIVLPEGDFAQREHLILLLFVPYVAACVAGSRQLALGTLIGAMAGAAGAIAASIKPTFALVPAFLEFWIFYRSRQLQWTNPRLVALVMTAAVVILVTLVFFPLYPSEVVPWATALYDGYDRPGFVTWPFAYITIPPAAILWLCWRPEDKGLTQFRDALGVAFLGAFLAFYIQRKGSSYQQLPALGMVFLLCAGALGSNLTWPSPGIANRLRFYTSQAAGLYCLLYFITARPMWDYRSMDPALLQDIARAPGSFVVYSTNVVPAFPAVLKTKQAWASRYPCLIMLPGLIKESQHGIASPWERPFRDSIVADFDKYKPATILATEDGDLSLPSHFNVLAWLRQDHRFAQRLAEYRDEGVRDGLHMFVRNQPPAS